MLDNNTHWLLSLYRTSEIGGALFFGQLAKSTRCAGMQQATGCCRRKAPAFDLGGLPES